MCGKWWARFLGTWFEVLCSWLSMIFCAVGGNSWGTNGICMANHELWMANHEFCTPDHDLDQRATMRKSKNVEKFFVDDKLHLSPSVAERIMTISA